MLIPSQIVRQMMLVSASKEFSKVKKVVKKFQKKEGMGTEKRKRRNTKGMIMSMKNQI